MHCYQNLHSIVAYMMRLMHRCFALLLPKPSTAAYASPLAHAEDNTNETQGYTTPRNHGQRSSIKHNWVTFPQHVL